MAVSDAPIVLWWDKEAPLDLRILTFLRKVGMASEELLSEKLNLSTRACRDICLDLAEDGILAYRQKEYTVMWGLISEVPA